MEKQAQYIKSIEIESLWSNRKHILWELRPGVNILSGSNGVGKSTIIKRSAAHLKIMHDRHVTRNPHEGVKITFYPEDATIIPFDVISSIDRPMLSSEMLEKISGAEVRTELDWQLYQLQRRYLNYQVNIGNRIISLLTSGNPDDQRLATELTKPKKVFQDLIDELFAATGKTIIRSKNEIFFNQYGETISPYILSSGEKQLLVIMLTALVHPVPTPGRELDLVAVLHCLECFIESHSVFLLGYMCIPQWGSAYVFCLFPVSTYITSHPW